MGIFNEFFDNYPRSNDRDILRSQRQQERITREFAEKVSRQLEEERKAREMLQNEMRRLRDENINVKNEINSLKRSNNDADRRRRAQLIEENRIREQQIAEKEKEEKSINKQQELSAKEYETAKKIIEKLKNQIQDAINNRNNYELDKLENKLKNHITLFKEDYTQNKRKIKDVKFVAELLKMIGDYYKEIRQYEKGLYYYVEAKNFGMSEENIADKIIVCSYNCGKYDEVAKYIDSYSSKVKTEEYLLKADIYFGIQNFEKLEETFDLINAYFIEEIDNVSKLDWDNYLSVLLNYIQHCDVKNQKLIERLAWGLLYRKKISDIKTVIDHIEDTHIKNFFKGVIAKYNQDREKALEKFKEGVTTNYGKLFYLNMMQDKITDSDIEKIDNLLTLNADELKPLIMTEEHFLNNKLELLGYKLKYLLKRKKEGLNYCFEQIKELLRKNRNMDIENRFFWTSYFEFAETLKNTGNDLYNEVKDLMYDKLDMQYIEELKNKVPEIEIDIDQNYTLKNKIESKTLYNEYNCANNLTGDDKIYVEFTENMSKSTKLNKKSALKEEKKLGEESDKFLKIDNFSLVDNKIKIITERYDKVYSEIKYNYCLLTLDEKLNEATKLVELFRELEKRDIVLTKLNEDNLVKIGNNYKCRFLKYSQLKSDNSLSSAKSTVQAKESLYETPELTDNMLDKVSNIYILGELFYDLFYEEHILSGLFVDLKHADKSRKQYFMKQNWKIREAFHKNERIDIELISHVDNDRIYLKENETAKIIKANKKAHVPNEIRNLIDNMLKNKFQRICLDDVEEQLEDIQENIDDILTEEEFIPKIIYKKNLNIILNKLSHLTECIYVREPSLLNISKNTSLNENASSLIVIGLTNGLSYFISNVGTEKYEITQVNTEKVDIDSELNAAIEKIDEISTEDKMQEKIMMKTNISADVLSTVLLTIREILNQYSENINFAISKEDRKELEKLKIFTNDQLNTMEQGIEEFLKYIKLLWEE